MNAAAPFPDAAPAGTSMAFPNLIGLLLLSGLVARETNECFARYP